MIRLLARLFGSNPPASSHGDDAIGELLRGAGHGDVTPEVLLRLL
jgi:hypothetical protein